MNPLKVKSSVQIEMNGMRKENLAAMGRGTRQGEVSEVKKSVAKKGNSVKLTEGAPSVSLRRRQKRRRAGRVENGMGSAVSKQGMSGAFPWEAKATTYFPGVRQCRVLATRTNRKLVWTWPRFGSLASGGSRMKYLKGESKRPEHSSRVRASLVGSAGVSMGSGLKQRSDRGTDTVAKAVRNEAKRALMRELCGMAGRLSKPGEQKQGRSGAKKKRDVDVLYEGKGKGRVLVRKLRKGRKKQLAQTRADGVTRRLRSVSDVTSEVHNGCSGKKMRRR